MGGNDVWPPMKWGNAFPVMEDGKVLELVTKFVFLRTFAFTRNQIVPHYDDLNRFDYDDRVRICERNRLRRTCRPSCLKECIVEQALDLKRS